MSTFSQEIHEAGQRFFQGLMPHENQQLWYRFMELDENRDGRITVQELLNRHRILNGGAVHDRVWMLLPLVDEDQNGVLDYDECKTLFFLFVCGYFCGACRRLIMYDGVHCLDCLLDLCSSCSHGHHHRRYRFRHRHHQYPHRFEALPPLLSSLPQGQFLPPDPAHQHQLVARDTTGQQVRKLTS